MKLELGRGAPRFAARCSVAWTTSELAYFAEALRTLLDDLTGVAKLNTIEDQVEITLKLSGGIGTMSGRIEEHAFAALEFEDVRTDQSQLRDGLASLREIVRRHPTL